MSELTRSEEEVLYGITSVSKELLNFYQAMYAAHKDEITFDDELKQELEEVRSILDYSRSVLDKGQDLDYERIENMIEREKEVEGLSKDLAKKISKSELSMAGTKGHELVNILEKLSEGLYRIEEVQETGKKGKTMDREVSTDNAKHVILYNRHDRQLITDSDALKNADALVLESALKGFESADLGYLFNRDYRGENPKTYLTLLSEFIKSGGRDIFIADTPVKGDSEEERMKKGEAVILSQQMASAGIIAASANIPGAAIGGAVAAAPVILSSLAGKLHSKGINLGHLKLFNLVDPMLARSALKAQKLESKVAKRAGSSGRPLIVTAMGAAHPELMLFLKNPRLRNFVIKLHRQANFPALDSKYVDSVLQFKVNSGGKYNFGGLEGIRGGINYDKDLF